MEQITNKNILFGFAVFILLTISAVLFTTQDAVGASEQVPLTRLTDSDIDMIMHVKLEMALAREERLARQ